MKKNLFLSIIGLILISAVSFAQNRILERPEVGNSDTKMFEINKIDFSDKETILYCDLYSLPGDKIRVASKSFLKGQSGKIYQFLSSEGFELDKEIIMPESGNKTFRLHFESLDKKEVSFDYNGSFVLTGIKTYKVKSINAPIHCILKGEVLDRPQSSRLILIKAGGDPNASTIYIPIRNGKFKYDLNCKSQEAYELVFYDELLNRLIQRIKFYSEAGIIKFKLFPMDVFYKNIIEGGKLNQEYGKYKQIRDSLFKKTTIIKEYNRLKKDSKYDSQASLDLAKQIGLTKDKHVKDSLLILWNKLYDSGKALTPEADALDKQSREM